MDIQIINIIFRTLELLQDELLWFELAVLFWKSSLLPGKRKRKKKKLKKFEKNRKVQ